MIWLYSKFVHDEVFSKEKDTLCLEGSDEETKTRMKFAVYRLSTHNNVGKVQSPNADIYKAESKHFRVTTLAV